MESQNSLRKPVRNYAKKVMELMKAESVQRGPPRRRLEIQMPLPTVSKKVKWATYQKAPSSFPITNTRNSSRKSNISRAVPTTSAQTTKVSGKPTAATWEVQKQSNRSRLTRIPVRSTEYGTNSTRKSYAAASKKMALNRRTQLTPQSKNHTSKPSRVSKEKEPEADISGVMLLEEDAKSEIGAGECSNEVPFRIPLNPILQTSDRSNELGNFDDSFNSLQKEYLAQLTKFHTSWMERFSLLYKRKAESTARKVTETGENMEPKSHRKSSRLSQKKLFVHSVPRDTPSRITTTARKQMNYLESFMCDN